MDKAGWRTSTHSQEFPGPAHYKFQSARDKPENRLCLGALLSRPEPVGFFFLWGYLKDLVYRDSPATIGELKDLINDHIQRVDADKDLWGRVIENFKKRMNLCLQPRRRHLGHIL